MARGITCRTGGLDAGRGGGRAQAPPEVEPYVRLRLSPPSEGPRPSIRVEKEGERKDPSEDESNNRCDPAAEAKIIHPAIVASTSLLASPGTGRRSARG
jgi:hypothetical protein